MLGNKIIFPQNDVEDKVSTIRIKKWPHTFLFILAGPTVSTNWQGLLPN